MEEREESHVADVLFQKDDKVPPDKDRVVEGDDAFLDADNVNNFQAASPNSDINFEKMAENYFARADKIQQ